MLCFCVLLNIFNFCFGLKKSDGWNYINLHCRENDNKPVDWWYMFKPPGEAAPYDDSGRNFSYILSDTPGRWQEPDRHITTNNMLQHTLAPIYRSTYVDRVAYLVFEGADPVGQSRGSKASGILMADEIGGVFITHTVPNLVNSWIDRPKFPEAELMYGHLLVCISMDISTLNELAAFMRLAGPRVSLLHVPEQLEVVVPVWKNINQTNGPTISRRSKSRTAARAAAASYDPDMKPLKFVSKQSALQGLVFLRRPGQNLCLYRAFADRESILLDVYSPDGKQKHSRCENRYGIQPIESISLNVGLKANQYVNSRIDKARFAVSAHKQIKERASHHHWTCTSSLDMSDDSGEGGILLCIYNHQVWTAFSNLQIKTDRCKGAIH